MLSGKVSWSRIFVVTLWSLLFSFTQEPSSGGCSPGTEQAVRLFWSNCHAKESDKMQRTHDNITFTLLRLLRSKRIPIVWCQPSEKP
jgi:hypothetical protein